MSLIILSDKYLLTIKKKKKQTKKTFRIFQNQVYAIVNEILARTFRKQQCKKVPLNIRVQITDGNTIGKKQNKCV